MPEFTDHWLWFVDEELVDRLMAPDEVAPTASIRPAEAAAASVAMGLHMQGRTREAALEIERALAFGIKPTHLDTHMGTLYTRKDFFDVYTKLGKEYGIPVMVMRPTPEAIQYGKLTGSPIGEDALKKIEADGYAMLDYLNTGVQGKTPAERKEAYKKFLRTMKPGVTMLIVHLGMNDPELKATTGSWEQRYGDFLAFTDPEIEALIKELGIKLTTWREMGKVAWKKK